MTKFMAVYVGTAMANAPPRAELPDDVVAKGMQAWGDWMARNAAAVVETGGPLGKTKKVGPGGVSDTRNDLVGYVVVEAPSHEAAAKMFEGHPHFSIFPGDSVEVMECLPIPTGP